MKFLWWNVRDFGAKGDQETDDTAAFQVAIDEAEKGRDADIIYVHNSKTPYVEVKRGGPRDRYGWGVVIVPLEGAKGNQLLFSGSGAQRLEALIHKHRGGR